MPEPVDETSLCGGSRRQASRDDGIAALASRQHVVFGLSQLVALGLSRNAVQKRTEAGRLHRIHQTVYSLVPPNLLTPEGHWMAAVLSCGPGAVVSHRTAAKLHGLLGYNGTKLDITVPGRHSRRRGRIVVHGSTTLGPKDVTVVNNVPCTTVARTLLDLAEVVDRRRHERAFDQAEVEEVLDMGAITDQLDRNSTRAAASRTKALLAEHYPGSTLTESQLEEAFLALCRRVRLPQPEVQQWIYLPDGGDPIRADFLWREERVVVETDGEKYHKTGQRRRSDRRKDQRLAVHGFRPVRTDARQVLERPAEIELAVRALLGQARPPGA
jgi:predicted transcriptional regulator of viral defense system